MGANTKMKIVVNSVLLLIAAALCIQAMTNDADLAEMGGEDESAGLGRRGGGEILTTSGSFVLSANRAGNDEEELGDTDTPLAPTGKDEIAREGLASSRSLLGARKDGTCQSWRTSKLDLVLDMELQECCAATADARLARAKSVALQQ